MPANPSRQRGRKPPPRRHSESSRAHWRVSLVGIDSVMCPMEKRREAWKRLASDLDAGKIAPMISEIDLAGVPDACRRILEGGVRGRIVVKIA